MEADGVRCLTQRELLRELQSPKSMMLTSGTAEYHTEERKPWGPWERIHAASI